MERREMTEAGREQGCEGICVSFQVCGVVTRELQTESSRF